MEGGGVVERVAITSSKIKGDRDRDRLETEIGGIEGVRSVETNTDGHTVEVTFDPSVIDRNAIQRAVEDAGYSVDAVAGGVTPTGA